MSKGKSSKGSLTQPSLMLFGFGRTESPNKEDRNTSVTVDSCITSSSVGDSDLSETGSLAHKRLTFPSATSPECVTPLPEESEVVVSANSPSEDMNATDEVPERVGKVQDSKAVSKSTPTKLVVGDGGSRRTRSTSATKPSQSLNGESTCGQMIDQIKAEQMTSDDLPRADSDSEDQSNGKRELRCPAADFEGTVETKRTNKRHCSNQRGLSQAESKIEDQSKAEDEGTNDTKQSPKRNTRRCARSDTQPPPPAPPASLDTLEHCQAVADRPEQEQKQEDRKPSRGRRSANGKNTITTEDVKPADADANGQHTVEEAIVDCAPASRLTRRRGGAHDGCDSNGRREKSAQKTSDTAAQKTSDTAEATAGAATADAQDGLAACDSKLSDHDGDDARAAEPPPAAHHSLATTKEDDVLNTDKDTPVIDDTTISAVGAAPRKRRSAVAAVKGVAEPATAGASAEAPQLAAAAVPHGTAESNAPPAEKRPRRSAGGSGTTRQPADNAAAASVTPSAESSTEPRRKAGKEAKTSGKSNGGKGGDKGGKGGKHAPSKGADASKPAARRERAAAAAAAAEERTGAQEEAEWRKSGNEHLGVRILRFELDAAGRPLPPGHTGTVMGWLPVEEADFISDVTGRPGALWHVLYDESDLGEEDLEEFEVQQAVHEYRLFHATPPSSAAAASAGVDGNESKVAAADSAAADGESKDSLSRQSRACGGGGAMEIGGDSDTAVDAGAVETLSLAKKEAELDTDVDAAATVAAAKPAAVKAEVDDSEEDDDSSTEVVGIKRSVDMDKDGGGGGGGSCFAGQRVKIEITRKVERLADIAVRLGVKVEALVEANRDNYPEISRSCRMRKGSVLRVPVTCPTLPGAAAAAAAEAGGRAGKSAGKGGKGQGAAAGGKGRKGAVGSSPPSAKGGGGGIGGEGNPYLSLAPNIKFPPYPGVTEEDGKIAASICIPFQCPFARKNGIIYATPGYEAVAPCNAKVEDKWAACDRCDKWRRLPSTFVVSETEPFYCDQAGRTCEDAEDPFDEDEEFDVANDAAQVVASQLPLTVGDLTVLELGTLVPEAAPGVFWTDRWVFPVGFRSKRLYPPTPTAGNTAAAAGGSGDGGGGGGESVGTAVAAGAAAGGEKQRTYMCEIERDGAGPLFRVTELAQDGDTKTARSVVSKSASAAWARIVRSLEGGGGGASAGGVGSSPGKGESSPAGAAGRRAAAAAARPKAEDGSEEEEEEGESGSGSEESSDTGSGSDRDSDMEDDAPRQRAQAAGRGGGSARRPRRPRAAAAAAAAGERESESGSGSDEDADEEDSDSGDDGGGGARRPRRRSAAAGKASGKPGGGAGKGDGRSGGHKRAVVNGLRLFGLAQKEVAELMEEMPGHSEIEHRRERLRQERMAVAAAEVAAADGEASAAALAAAAASVERRMVGMPPHLQDKRDARIPVRSVSGTYMLVGDEAPRLKDLRRYLRDHPEMEAFNPMLLPEEERRRLDDACARQLCWECKRGLFAKFNHSKIQCRIEMGHNGADWRSDAREKAMVDPSSHFKSLWKEGSISKLDYNSKGHPLLLRIPVRFVEDALLDGKKERVIQMERRPDEGQGPAGGRMQRLSYSRPAWPAGWSPDGQPPVPPENESGCARGQAWDRRRCFSDKCEFTSVSRPDSYFTQNRLVSEYKYHNMSVEEKFAWMVANQRRRLALGYSAIQGMGVFANAPIYKGEMVVEYTGERIRPVIADMREESYEQRGIGTYFWRVEEFGSPGDPLEGRAAIVDATVKHNLGHYINHSCLPNCQSSIIRLKNAEGRLEKRIVITAMMDIKFGEELTYDYKLPLVDCKSLQIPCACGASARDLKTGEIVSGCRKTLN